MNNFEGILNKIKRAEALDLAAQLAPMKNAMLLNIASLDSTDGTRVVVFETSKGTLYLSSPVLYAPYLCVEREGGTTYPLSGEVTGIESKGLHDDRAIFRIILNGDIGDNQLIQKKVLKLHAYYAKTKIYWDQLILDSADEMPKNK